MLNVEKHCNCKKLIITGQRLDYGLGDLNREYYLVIPEIFTIWIIQIHPELSEIQQE